MRSTNNNALDTISAAATAIASAGTQASVQPVPQRPRPPPFFPKNHHSVDNFGPFVETQRTTVSPLYGVTRQSCQAILATHGLAKTNLQSYLMILEIFFATKNVDAQAPKRTRSPPIPSADEVSQENSHLSRNDKIQAVLEACVCPRLVELLLSYTRT
ncbi:hypothetical protein ACSBR1_023998 [Camellia fascicularis]